MRFIKMQTSKNLQHEKDVSSHLDANYPFIEIIRSTCLLKLLLILKCNFFSRWFQWFVNVALATHVFKYNVQDMLLDHSLCHSKHFELFLQLN